MTTVAEKKEAKAKKDLEEVAAAGYFMVACPRCAFVAGYGPPSPHLVRICPKCRLFMHHDGTTKPLPSVEQYFQSKS